MRLYITPGSPYARIARVVVIEKGLENRVEIVVAQTRLAGSPYYRINPSGRVPYLVRDDGVGMEESALICDYLDGLDGEPRFGLPAGADALERRESKTFLARVFDGAVAPALVHFIQEADLSPKEIAELKKILDREARR